MRDKVDKLSDLSTYFGQGLIAHVTFDRCNWAEDYSHLSRTYEIDIDASWGLNPDKCGTSITGSSLDGSDLGVRLEKYQWKIEKITLLLRQYTNSEEA